MNSSKSIFSKILILIVLIFVSISYSQKINISNVSSGLRLQISFSQIPFKLEGENNNTINYFNQVDESKPGAPNLPSKTLFIAIPPNCKVRVKNNTEKLSYIESVIPKSNPEVELQKETNLVYKQTQISPSYHQDNVYPSNEYEILGYTWIRNYYCVELKINTHRYDWNKRRVSVMNSTNFDLDFYDLKSYDINKTQQDSFETQLKNLIANFDDASQYRSFRPTLPEENLKDNWIDFNAEYLKIGVALDGIYRISKNDLQSFNINTAAINPNTFKMFLKGNQVPIYVAGEEDNSLDDNDYIEFYGSMNYGEKDYRILNHHDEPYNDYIDKYSDTTIYWLTWGGDNGLRIDTSSFNSTGISDTLNYYTSISHFEQNNYLDYSTRNIVDWQNPEWIYNESWIWGNHDVGTKNWNFNVSDLVNNKPAEAFFRLRSYASDVSGDQNAHDYALSINSNPTMYDSGYINKYEQKILFAGFSSDLLQDGQNTLKTHSFPVENSVVNLTQVDWYEIEYPRYLSLVNDSLKFKFNLEDLNSFELMKITNAQAANHILYKLPAKRRISNLLQVNDEIFFTDTVKTGDEFYISTEDQIKKPKFYYKKKFDDLTSNGIQADYILISHPAFNAEVNEYLTFIQNNYNVTAKYVNVLDIYDQFNYGFFSPEPIKDFLHEANINWTAPKPAYVFLVGEADYDYHNYKQIENYVPNYVPSFGHPVSDNWFVIWDSLATVPQMFIGRLAVNSKEQFAHYIEKHKEYLNQNYNIWNKSYFLLSGGANESEKSTAKDVNDYIRTNLITPKPTGGYTGQLYATENPKTNFGPFSQTHIDSVFDNGGIIISYLGHSGTKIWDNGIESAEQLYNKYNRSSLITDFGCSTGKFAEPDIVSFSENFTSGLDGEAIAYMGNSSLGFTSTSYSFPKIFFEQMFKSSSYNISAAHIAGKEKLFQDYGNTGTSRLFVLTNTLLGDPIISLKIPDKPNLNITSSDIKLPSFLDDNLDSIQIGISYRNLGLVDSVSFNIKIEDYLNNALIYSVITNQKLPLNDKIIIVNVPIKNRAGEHSLIVTLDDANEISEIYENDNTVSVHFNVQTSSVRNIVSDTLQIISDGKIRLLNPVKPPQDENILISLSSTKDFTTGNNYQIKLDTMITDFSFSNLINNKRYWYMTGFASSPNTVFSTNSFIYDNANNYNFAFIDSSSTKDFSFNNTNYDNGSVKLGDSRISLIVSSTGTDAGGIAKIEFNNVDYAENPRGCGHHIVVIDEATMQFEDYKWFNYWSPPNDYNGYVEYLNTLGADKLVVISIGADCAGYNISQELKDKLHEFGSVYIDSVALGTSWLFLGKLGTPIGSMPEAFSRTAPVSFDTLFVRTTQAGSFSIPSISNAASWDSLYINIDSISSNSQVKIRPVIYYDQPDTLTEIPLNDGRADISYLNNYGENGIGFSVDMFVDESGKSPLVKSIKIKYNLYPELGTNYQVVSTTADTVLIGDDVGLKFYVYNVGESTADSFKVQVDVVNSDNTHDIIFSTIVDSLQTDSRKVFDVTYNTTSGVGAKSFLINIDSDNKVRELYEDNNFYTVPFYIKQDTSKPSLTVAFDEGDILDGDYISATPKIKIELYDETMLPIKNKSAVSVYLNNELVDTSNNQSVLSYEFGNENPKVVVNYTPTLEDGDYTLKVFGENSLGTLVDSSGYEKHFQVSNEVQLLNVYNYPNPTRGVTYFTFKLTQIPDEIRIKIYTIAGRLIREIIVPSSDLNYDFNKIYWDGRDQDGDVPANGVYLYKVIMTAGDKTEDVIQKLAIVR